MAGHFLIADYTGGQEQQFGDEVHDQSFAPFTGAFSIGLMPIQASDSVDEFFISSTEITQNSGIRDSRNLIGLIFLD